MTAKYQTDKSVWVEGEEKVDMPGHTSKYSVVVTTHMKEKSMAEHGCHKVVVT